MAVAESGEELLRAHSAALGLTVIAVLWSAMHFWPFEQSKLWQLLNPANLAPVLWASFLAAYVLIRRRWGPALELLPHVSVLAYLAVVLLSVAFAREMSRAVSFSVKAALMYVPGYMLFRVSLRDNRSIRVVLGAALVAAALCIAGALTDQLIRRVSGFGFHSSAYKYGTYIGILVSLAGGYLLPARGWRRPVGAAFVVAGLCSAGSLGALVAVVVGMVLMAAVRPDRGPRVWAVVAVIFGVMLNIVFQTGATGTLRADLSVLETKGTDVRQRYIEWQAEINLLEDRAITGTGAGSINDYRSIYYNRLPKLNTLEAFDQNGWVATSAETGILGLVCLSWVVGHYSAVAWRRAVVSRRLPSDDRLDRAATAGRAALGAALAANTFSSVHYNGVLIVFVFVLALVSGVDRVLGDSCHAA